MAQRLSSPVGMEMESDRGLRASCVPLPAVASCTAREDDFDEMRTRFPQGGFHLLRLRSRWPRLLKRPVPVGFNKTHITFLSLALWYFEEQGYAVPKPFF